MAAVADNAVRVDGYGQPERPTATCGAGPEFCRLPVLAAPQCRELNRLAGEPSQLVNNVEHTIWMEGRTPVHKIPEATS